MPIEGFDVGGSLPKPTYGLSLNEDLVLADQSTLNGSTNLSPIVGVGASLYADGAGVFNGNGPLVILGGVNVIGPDLDFFGMGNGQGACSPRFIHLEFRNRREKNHRRPHGICRPRAWNGSKS